MSDYGMGTTTDVVWKMRPARALTVPNPKLAVGLVR
jgi:hypothetical protein